MIDEGRNEGSFRDPAGYIFSSRGKVYRQINNLGSKDYDLFMSSGLYQSLLDADMIVAHKEVNLDSLTKDEKRYKIIQPTLIPFISYPYEWTFGQLKAASALTLDIMKVAIEHGMILKDASAYNVQFVGNKPVFIDTLSFAEYKDGAQWEGYKQFCEHFVAPLALSHYATPNILKSLRVHLDGIPLSLACQLLPSKARLRVGLLAHLYIHGSSQRRHQQGGEEIATKAKSRKMTKIAMLGLISSLERTIKKLEHPQNDTEWGDYYKFTNYSDEAFQAKRKLVSSLLDEVPGKLKMVWDVGANNGEFSELAVEKGAYTVAFDIDEVAVSRNFKAKRVAEISEKMLPLVQDLTNPSPGLGWAHKERESLVGRGPADVVMALAIIHHLAIGNNLPFEQIASFLHDISKYLIIEFVPKGDSKVDHLLASRKDIFKDYDAKIFEKVFERHFKLVDKKPVKGSKRTIYLYKSK